MKLSQIETWLIETGLPYTIDRGGRHYKLKLCGHLVGIFPITGKGIEGRAAKNIRAQIRRKAKELKDERKKV